MSVLRAMAAGLIAVIACVAGCATPGEGGASGVTLGELDAPRESGTETLEGQSQGEAGDAERADRPGTAVSMQSFELPLESSLEEAFSYTEPAPLPRLSLGVWQANGIRVAVLPLADWPDFYAKLPEALSVRQTRLLASDDPVAVVTSPRLVRPIRIDLTVPPMRPREAWARRGRLRLLAEVAAPRDAGTVAGSADASAQRRRISLIPHHLLPQQVVLPDTMRSDRMPGVVFDRLALRMELSAETLLILALDRPWDREAPVAPDSPESPDSPEKEPGKRGDVEPSPVAGVDRDATVSAAPKQAAGDAAATRSQREGTASDEADEAQEGESSDADRSDASRRRKPAMPEVSPTLGRALLAGQKWDRPVQRLVVISVRPLQSLNMPREDE
jgi:hypothetical protein